MDKISTQKHLLIALAIISYLPTQLFSQNIVVQPYLQDAAPHSIYILWETDLEEESIVEWGLTNSLGNETTGIAYPSEGTARIHEVHLENLERFTSYFYRVKTNNAISEIFSFKTPPFASDNEPFRVLAMSDMQQDGALPNKFKEVVEDGVLTYLENQIGGGLTDNLALVMIPGDLVTNGLNYASWQNTFFKPAEKLLSSVPVYPVPGNHENDAAYFFTYFKLPNNGAAGSEEHWWSKDYGNVRIIGMDSNGPYNNQEQLDWLEDLLNNTCSVDSIDFVFAQLHHPHKSELWTPGESNFTGEVIEHLEQFSSDCNKPSIHFFGHTHGYSRGQSRDHKHLWINVATAGGAIDNWGEFPNFDYDEFSVSQDEYGFVLVEITNDTDPKLVIKRISRGDQDITFDNLLTDSLTLRLNNALVNTPQALSPINDLDLAPECVILKGSTFSAPSTDAEHGQSHWQVSTLQVGFNNPIAESWLNFENWYYDINTQLNDDLTDEKISGLEPFTEYIWRMRYRDKEMNWSDWSSHATFNTTASLAQTNLIINPSAEDDLNNWSIAEGVVEALEAGVCDGTVPLSGNQYFAVGGLCDHSEIGRLTQDINLSAYIDSIDSGDFLINFGAYLSNFSGSDLPELKMTFLDEDLMELAQSNTLSTLNNSWTLLSDTMYIPTLTRNLRIELKGTRNAGTDNDSYFDDVFVHVGTPPDLDCTPISATNRPLVQTTGLNVFPNPASNEAKISIPESLSDNYYLTITNSAGQKVNTNSSTDKAFINIDLRNLKQGHYFIWLRGSNGERYSSKLIIAK